LVADALPIYPLYALLFADHGLSTAQISVLFAIWSTVAIVLEVPTGAIADRFSRRGSLVAAGLLQGTGYVVWISLPGFAGYAAGFVLWGVGGALVSGAFEALLYDGLVAAGAEDQFGRLLGRVTAAELVSQLPAAAGAAVLFSLGGYPLVAWVSVGCCLVAAALAARLPEPPRDRAAAGEAEPSLLASLRDGLAVVRGRPDVRLALLAVAGVTPSDGLDEYFPLLARDWGVPTNLNPLATVGIPLTGAAGAALGGAAARLSTARTLALVFAASGLLLGAAGLLRQPAGLAAVALFYGLYHVVLVVANTRLQERIVSSSRATVASVGALGTEVFVFGVYGAWALGGVLLIAPAVIVVAAAIPRLLGERGATGV
jgi:MFS family permease